MVETSHWLNSYTDAKAFSAKALSIYEQKKSQEILDNMRLSLEYYVCQFEVNTKPLENNKTEIGKYLKTKGTILSSPNAS